MFVDFNRVFNGKPQTELKIPDAMIKHLNTKLPPGVMYRATEDGNCEIISAGESVTVGGLIFVPTDEQLKILGKKCTREDILKYSYNAQKPIPLKLKKEGYVILNGEEYPIEKIHYNPYSPISIVSGKIFMHPKPFPQPFALTIGNKKYTKQMFFERIPNESIHISKFESKKEQPLMVRYSLDESKHTISFNISYNLSYAKTVKDIVESTSIFNSFVDGEGLFCGDPLVANFDKTEVKKYDPDSVIFWEKVLLVEEALETTFTPPNDDVDFSTMRTVETLYQNLINNNPIRENRKIDSLDGEWDIKDVNGVETAIGQPAYFEFEATSNVSLFGIEKKLPCVIGVFDSLLSNYTVKGKKYKLFLENLSEEKHMYISTLRFKTEEELKAYMGSNSDERITTLNEAKTVQYYLST